MTSALGIIQGYGTSGPVCGDPSPGPFAWIGTDRKGHASRLTDEVEYPHGTASMARVRGPDALAGRPSRRRPKSRHLSRPKPRRGFTECWKPRTRQVPDGDAYRSVKPWRPPGSGATAMATGRTVAPVKRRASSPRTRLHAAASVPSPSRCPAGTASPEGRRSGRGDARPTTWRSCPTCRSP